MVFYLKTLHITCAAFSFLGFLIRGWWALQHSPLLYHRITRVVPHVIDTVLLLSAVGLLWQYQLSPLNQPWLLSKIVGLLLYIGFGTVALKRGKTVLQRRLAFVCALLCFAHIVTAAVTKSPWGILVWLS